MEIIELVEISWKDFEKKYSPKRNPSTDGNTFPDILKHNPEYCYKEAKKKRVWSVLHQKNDVYIVPGIKRNDALLGLVFTKKPYSSDNEVIVL